MDKIIKNVDNEYRFNWSIPTLVLSVIVGTIICIEIFCWLVLKSSLLYYIINLNRELFIIISIITFIFAIIAHKTPLFKKREYKINRNLYRDTRTIITVLFFVAIIWNAIEGVYYG